MVPGIIISCTLKLKVVTHEHKVTAAPDWGAIGHDDPAISSHPWAHLVKAWEDTGDTSYNLSCITPGPASQQVGASLSQITPSASEASLPPATPSMSESAIDGDVEMSDATGNGKVDKGKGRAMDMIGSDGEEDITVSAMKRPSDAKDAPRSAMKKARTQYVEIDDDEPSVSPSYSKLSYY